MKLQWSVLTLGVLVFRRGFLNAASISDPKDAGRMAEDPSLPSDAAAALLGGLPAWADAPSQVGHEEASGGSMSSGSNMRQQPDRRRMMPSVARLLGDQETAASQNSSAASSRSVGGARSNAAKPSAAADSEVGSLSAAGSSTDSPAAPAADRRARLSKEAFVADAHAGRYDLPLLHSCAHLHHVIKSSPSAAVAERSWAVGVKYMCKHSLPTLPLPVSASACSCLTRPAWPVSVLRYVPTIACQQGCC